MTLTPFFRTTAALFTTRCQEHQILRGRLMAHTKVYADATRRLDHYQPVDFKEISQAAESARLAYLKAREVLAAHIIVHGCEP